jgi:clan AA aspartic protease
VIRGIVRPSRSDNTGLEAWVNITLAGNQRIFQTVEAIVDTGYTGWLTAPEATAYRLGLETTDTRHGTLADGQDRETEICEAVVLWHERPVDIWVDVTGAAPLIGTDMLAGSRLTIDWRDGGEVLIEDGAAAGE